VTLALLITNPAAARTDALAVRAVIDTLRDGGWSVDVLATHGPGDARRFAVEAGSQGCDVVVSYGGDGTAMQIAAGLLGSGIPLGLVAGGTGNLLAGNLRLPRDPVAAARAMLRGTPRLVDLGAVERRDGTHYFAVAGGAGYDAEVMARTAAVTKQRWKMAAYLAHGLATLRHVTSVPHRVTVDGRVHEAPAAVVLIANCGELIPPVVKLRNVHPDDGWFDVMVLRAEGVAQSLHAAWDLLLGVQNGSGRVWLARGRDVRVEVVDGPQRRVQLDGEVVGETPFEVRLLPGALAVLAPPVAASPRRRVSS
jgi:YegS/Rv2252/BmrU family lipid kinase